MCGVCCETELTPTLTLTCSLTKILGHQRQEFAQRPFANFKLVESTSVRRRHTHTYFTQPHSHTFTHTHIFLHSFLLYLLTSADFYPCYYTGHLFTVSKNLSHIRPRLKCCFAFHSSLRGCFVPMCVYRVCLFVLVCVYLRAATLAE